MLICFEGMDGVGKSTVAEKVSQLTGIAHTPQRIMDLFDISREKFDRLAREVNYLPLIFYTFKCMLDKNSENDLIVERGMMSTYYFERDKVTKKDFDYMMKMNVMPDITFLLYASKDTRIQRIMNRNINDDNLNDSTVLNDGYDKMLQCAIEYNIPYVGINTEKFDFKQIVITCSKVIINYQKLKTLEQKREYLKGLNDTYGFDQLYKINTREKLVV